jgi:capsule polysaccharide export protein KpsE/RkpR
MAYDFSSLTTWDMCDRAKALADPVHDDISFQLSLLGRHNTIATSGATTTDANLDAATIEVTALTASVAGLAAGSVREKYARKLRRATEHMSQLTDRATDFDGVILINNEYAKRRLTAGLTETDTYLAELAVHRDTLTS